MKSTALFVIAVSLLVSASAVQASDACSTRAIETHASVEVSDGSEYAATSYFHSADANAIRFVREDETVVAAEGPYAWVETADGYRSASPAQQTFALGHQYHALLLAFDDIMEDVEAVEDIDFDGASRSGRRGVFPAGGVALMIDGDAPDSPVGLRFELPDAPPIDSHFEDWRSVDGRVLPHRIRIDDGSRQFVYRYEHIAIGDRSPLWFIDALPVSGVDEVEIYRLHRRLLAAHCLGDAVMMASLSDVQTIVANRGALARPTRDEMRERFGALFERLDYRAYIDLEPPHIEVASAGDLGWAVVNVRTSGVRRSDKGPFDHEWAWVMLARKVDGRWLNAGNASNSRSN